MARQFTLADTVTWPPREQRVFVLEHLLRAHEDDLVSLEASCRANPDSAPHASRAADSRVIIRVLNDILAEWRPAST
jgi:hypothetical protein